MLLNFCGDSFLRYDTPESWCVILAKKLQADILGFGRSGSAFEHAINTFDPKADLTIFCWTEPDRLYHPDVVINYARAEAHKKNNLIYQAAYLYYKFVHESKTAQDSQKRQLYWFDKTQLSQYKGKCIHLWSYRQTYKFENGTTYLPALKTFCADEKDEVANHFTVQQNKDFAETMYELIKSIY